jgi:hypothetical protein
MIPTAMFQMTTGRIDRTVINIPIRKKVTWSSPIEAKDMMVMGEKKL